MRQEQQNEQSDKKVTVGNKLFFVCAHSMCKALLLILIIVGNALLVSGCDKKQSNDWASEEVLSQLTELRKEVKELKSDVATLTKNIAGTQAKQSGARENAAVVGKVKFDKYLVLGSDKANIGIVEFADFQCPFCAKYVKETFPEVKKQLVDTGKVQYKVMDYPLGFHANARGAAIAAHCANGQTQYWAMRDELFSNIKNLNEAFYKQAAEKLKLDMDKFTDCLKNPVQAKLVDDGMAYGGAVGVNGTPSFFVGRIVNDELVDVIALTGAQPFRAFEQAVNQLSQPN